MSLEGKPGDQAPKEAPRTGYEGPRDDVLQISEAKPEELEWSWQLEPSPRSMLEGIPVMAVLELSGEKCGYVRLPNMECLKWLRQRTLKSQDT